MRAPHRQRGVALIIALILVALAAILATKLTFDGWLERQRTVSVLASEQALHFAMGAEALAADALSQTATGTLVTLAQPWAQATQPLPLTPPDNAEGEPIGTLQAGLEDLQGRFNLNNLARASTTGDGTADPEYLEQFKRLLNSLQLEEKWAGIARDWIDADDQPGNPDGAEDAIYTAQTPPYRTGNWPMTSATELMNLPGFGLDRYRKLAPYVTALPTGTPINICTASGPVLDSLAANLSGEYGRDPQALTENRKNGCFPDPVAFNNILGKSLQAVTGHFGTKSNYFRLTTRVTLGTREYTLYSLLQLGQSAKVAPLVRSFGTL